MSNENIIEITEKDLWGRLEDPNFGTKNSQKLRVIENVHLDRASVEFDYKIIRDVEFQEDLIIEDLELKFGLGFFNCTFRKPIIVRNFNVQEYSRNNYGNNSLFFNNCKGKAIIINGNVQLHRALLIENECEFENLTISGNVKIGNGGINISNSNFTKLIEIIAVESFGFKINNSTIDAKLRIESVETDISFAKVSFKNSINLWNVTMKNSFISNYCVYEDTVKFDACKIKGVYIHNDSFYRQFSIKLRDAHNSKLGYLKSFYCREMNFLEGFYLDGADEKIEQIELPLSSSAKGYLKFENAVIDETKLHGINEDVKITFKNIKFRNLSLIDFTNLNLINFNRCGGLKENSSDEESSLNMVDSDLGEMKMNSFSFKSFGVIQIDNISIYKMAISNVEWFDENQLKIVGGSSPTEKERSKREIYRQFKQALKSSGNILESIDFRAKELRSYRNELDLSENYPWTERIVMLVNQSNNYGLSWWKPVWIIFLITLGFYILFLPIFSDLAYCLCTTETCIEETWNIFFSEFDVFFQLFNPVRKFDSVYDTVSTDLMYLYDLLHRIILGVFIYQIIKAFRKYV